MTLSEAPAVVAFRECLYIYARAQDYASLREAVLHCAAVARGTLPPELLIKVLREELPAIAGQLDVNYWRAKTDIIDWILTAYFGPKDADSRQEA